MFGGKSSLVNSQRWQQQSQLAVFDRTIKGLSVFTGVAGGAVAASLATGMVVGGPVGVAILVASAAFACLASDWKKYEKSDVARAYSMELKNTPLEKLHQNREMLARYGFISKNTKRELDDHITSIKQHGVPELSREGMRLMIDRDLNNLGAK